MKKIKIIRMLGEDICAEVIGETDTSINVRNPVRVVIIPNKADPKNPQVGFAPYMDWSSDTTFTLSKNLFICMAEPLPVFVDQYKQQFSNLIIPGSSTVIPMK